MMGHGFGYGYGYGIYNCGGLIPMLFILAVFGLFVFLIMKRPRKYSEHSSQAMTLLNERLAKGEVTQEEYEILRKIIKQ